MYTIKRSESYLMMRTKRQDKILELISQNEIETQEELVDELKKAGFDVTQATISRDIKDLRLVKITENGKQRYDRERLNSNVTQKFRDMYKHSILSVENAGNLVVLKTLSASANVVAIMVDRLNNKHVLGCVAGDDTAFVACRDEAGAKEVCKMLTEIAAD